MRFLLFYIFIIALSVTTISCSDEEITGCTDPDATNFNIEASVDDGSCTYQRDQFIGSYKIATSNCTPSEFITGLTATISEIPGDVNIVSVSIGGIYQKSIIFSGMIANGGIDLTGEYIVPGNTEADIFTYNGVSYLLPRFIIDGRLEGNTGTLYGRISLEAEATTDNDATIFSSTCDYLLD